MNKVDKIIADFGITENDNGPYVAEFRAWVEKRVAEGMQRLHVSWGPEAGDVENRVKAFLVMEWNNRQGYAVPIQNIDNPTLRDRWNKFVAKFRINRDRILGVHNPYE